jgi:FKBP-type peptidyl-prolyl cis-trans isomerase (trigger factor)
MMFRVHLSTGEKVDVEANTPAQAASSALAGKPGVATVKIKRVRS